MLHLRHKHIQFFSFRVIFKWIAIQNHQNPCMFQEFGVPAFLSVKGGCPACHCGTWENPRHLGWATDPDAVAEAPCWLALPPGRAARCVDQRPGSIRLLVMLKTFLNQAMKESNLLRHHHPQSLAAPRFCRERCDVASTSWRLGTTATTRCAR